MDRQLQYLEAMGIQAWRLRKPPSSTIPIAEEQDAEAPVQPGLPARAEGAVEETASTASALTVESNPVVDAPRRMDTSQMDWTQLAEAVARCRLCELHQSRTQTVFGVGNRSADWLVVGEAPGKDEDAQGEPFVGRAGQLLNAMLKAVGLQREQVYIANILKCRPPNNRDPRPEEVVCCEPYLARQIALIQPRIVLAVGRIAAQNLLKTDTPIGQLRGKVHTLGDSGIPVIATYHPAYLLRSPLEKRKAWDDLQLAMTTVRGTSQ